MTPTYRQNELLKFIKLYTDEHMTSPNFDEMAEHMKVNSKSAIHRLLQALEERGAIRRLHGRSRAIEVVERNALVGERRRMLASQLAQVARTTIVRVAEEQRTMRPGELEAALLAVLP